jgi:hypothetical protein
MLGRKRAIAQGRRKWPNPGAFHAYLHAISSRAKIILYLKSNGDIV